MKMKSSHVIWCASALVALSACSSGEGAPPKDGEGAADPAPSSEAIQAQNAAAELAAGLVYTLDVEPGHAIKFFAPQQNGVVYMMEEGSGEQNPALRGGEGSASGIFKALRPAETVPEVLVRLDASLDHGSAAELPATAVPLLDQGESGPAEGNAGTVEKDVSSSGWDFSTYHQMCPTQFSTCSGLGTDYWACLPNVNGGWWTYDTVTNSQIYVMAYDGNVIITPSTNHTPAYTYTLLSGNWTRIAAWSKSRVLHRYDMTGGAGFHFGSLFANSDGRCNEIDVSFYRWP